MGRTPSRTLGLVASATVLALIASACGSGADEQQEPAPAFGSVPLHDTNDHYAWAYDIGHDEDDIGYGIVVDSDGNVYVTGLFRGTDVDFDPLGGVHTPSSKLTASNDKSDVFLAKYDSDGVYQWASNFGGDEDDVGRGIAVDSDGNVYITGRFRGIDVDFDP